MLGGNLIEVRRGVEMDPMVWLVILGVLALVAFAESVYFVDLQVKQAQFQAETKTRDNVFVQIPVSVQYQILSDKIYDAFYKLSAPQKQIESFVFNSILGHVP